MNIPFKPNLKIKKIDNIDKDINYDKNVGKCCPSILVVDDDEFNIHAL